MPAAVRRPEDWEWLVLVRVDDRLLHGQVALNWGKALRPGRVVIADDALARDALGRAAAEASAPAGVTVWIGCVGEAADLLRKEDAPHERTIVLLRSPVAARELHDAGVTYPRLNLGAVGAGHGRVRIGPQVCVSRVEWEALQYLDQAGVEVSVQALPSDAKVALGRVPAPYA